MAVGEIGFNVKPMGYDRNEVNEYISNLHKRMKDIETQSVSGGERAVSSKIMEDAKVKIAAIQSENQKLISGYEQKLKDMRNKADDLEKQNGELKRRLQNSGQSGLSDTAEEEKRAAEIIAEAEKAAGGIIEKAKRTAAGIISSAQIQARKASVSGGGTGSDACAVMAAVSEFVNSVTTGFNTLTVKTSGLHDASNVTAVKTAPTDNADFDSKDETDNIFSSAFADDSEHTGLHKSVMSGDLKARNDDMETELNMPDNDGDSPESDFSIFNASLGGGDTDDSMGAFSMFEDIDGGTSGVSDNVNRTASAVKKTTDKAVKGSTNKTPDKPNKTSEVDFSMFDTSADGSAGSDSNDSDDLMGMFAMFGGSSDSVSADKAPDDKGKAAKQDLPKLDAPKNTDNTSDTSDDSDDLMEMFAMFGGSSDSSADKVPTDKGKSANPDLSKLNAPQNTEITSNTSDDSNDSEDSDDSDDLMGMFAMFGGSSDSSADKAPTDKVKSVKPNFPKPSASENNSSTSDTSNDLVGAFVMFGAPADSAVDNGSAKTDAVVFSMNGGVSDTGVNTLSSLRAKETDEMSDTIQRLLNSAESDFGSISAPAKMTEPEEKPQPDPWADLQAQLNDEDDSFMENVEDDNDPFKSLDGKSGGKTSSDDGLWGFGSMGTYSDDMRDDIGGDIFGSF